jgi:hypothetical protein
MFKRLPIGITSAPEHLQKRISQILEGVVGVIVHLDDILVWGATKKEYNKRLRDVFQRLQEAGFTLEDKKSVFNVTSVKFLGHILDGEGVHPDPSKVEAISMMPHPTSQSDVRRLLGMI